MGGKANFNLLSFKGVGMLEFTFGKDGVSLKIGMGGTNISIQNLASAFGGGHKYDSTTGPVFANVGDADFTGTGQKAIEAFGKDNYQSIKYYYDKDQFKNRRWY